MHASNHPLAGRHFPKSENSDSSNKNAAPTGTAKPAAIPFTPEYTPAATPPNTQIATTTHIEARTRLILAAILAATLSAQPPDLARRAAASETAATEARAHYTYRQSVRIQELPSRNSRGGEYREEREIIFSPTGDRSERFLRPPISNLSRLRLTEEDFTDIRDVQPFLLTTDRLWLYQTAFKGEEIADNVDCWILEIKPKQIHLGLRLFEGLLWIDKSDFSVYKTEGVAVPKIFRKNEENLFPRFTTFRERVDGHRFPIKTFSDDTLDFSSGPLRLRMHIDYTAYQKFGAASTITFENEKSPRP